MNTIRHRYSIVNLMIIAGFTGLASSGAVDAGTPGDACALLTAPQVSSALGACVGPGQPVMPNNTKTCTWSEQGASTGAERNVTVSLMTATSFENGKTPMTGVAKTPESEQKDQSVDRALALEILKKL